MFENTKNWILQNILSNVKEHNSAKLIRESFFKVMEQTEQFILATGAGLYTGKISPSSQRPNGLNSGVFLVTEQGTYTNFGNVVLPANSFGFILWNGATFTISTILIPTYDATPLLNRMTALENEWDNYAVEVDEDFSDTSSNAIANKKVTELKNVVDSFFSEVTKANLTLNFIQGIINNSGVINTSTTSTKYIEIIINSEWNSLKINAKFWESTQASAISQYPTVIAENQEGDFQILQPSKLLSGSTNPPFEIMVENIQRFKKVYINALNAYALPSYIKVESVIGIESFDSVKKYIDSKALAKEKSFTEISNLFDINNVKNGYSLNATTGAEVAVSNASISNFISVKLGDKLTFNSDRLAVGYKINEAATTNIVTIYPALDSTPTQVNRTIEIEDENIKFIRFVYLTEWVGMFANRERVTPQGIFYISTEDIEHKGKNISQFLSNSKLPIKPYIYPLRKKIINASIRENDIISAIGNNIVKYGLNEVETIVHTITSVSDWRCVWTAKNGITYFSPMNSYSNETDVSNYGLYRYDDNNVTKVIQLTNRQSIWGIDEDNQGNLYAGVYDLGGASNPSLFKSTDGGLNWSVIKSWSNLRHIHDVMVDKKTNHLYVFLGDTYAEQQNFKSTDGGLTWVNVCQSSKIQMTDSVASENYRFFGTDHSPYGRIYRTADDLTMEISLDIGYYSNIFFLRVSDLTGWIYAGFKSDPSATGSGLLCSVWVSKNEGDTWEEVKRLNAPVAGDGFWFASEFKDGNLIIGCRQGGNGHANWQGYGITENANLTYNTDGIIGTRLKAFL